MTRVAVRSESGFTLIELMVALVVGLIVATATMAIVITSVHLSSNYNDRVDANQQGRVAMLKVIQALNSSCVASAVAPILPASDSNDAWFYSLLGDGPTQNPSEVEVSLTGGSLVMKTYPYASGTAPNWVFSGTASSTFTLLQYAQAMPSTPVFQYFGYSGGALSTTAYSVSPNLGSNAATTAEVEINFIANPSDNWTAQNRTASLSDTVVLRLATASGGATNLPCT